MTLTSALPATAAGAEALESALTDLAGLAPSEVSFPAAREHRLELLADLIEQHLDVDALLELARRGPPPGLPFLPPGAP